MTALVGLNEETDGALNHDLMVGLGITIDQAHLVGWANIADYVRHLGEGSAVRRHRQAEQAAYGSATHIAYMLADIYDLLNIARTDGIKSARKPKRYPRPDDRETRRIGRGAIPIRDFMSWYYGEV